MIPRKVRIGLVGVVVGLGFVFGACGNPESPAPIPTAPSVGGLQTLPDADQKQQNQHKVHELCPICFPDGTPVNK